ncbi:MAG: efflux transporter outer membrane subunit [Burkholderiales bacterium]
MRQRHASGYPLRSAAALSLGLLLSGCAVGPDFQRPAAPAAARHTLQALAVKTVSVAGIAGEAQSFSPERDISGQWWELFRSAALNELIRQALQSNPDLQAAQAALRAAQENTLAGRGAYFPALDGKLGANRQQANSASTGQAAAATSVYTLYNASVGVSYTLDAFGGVQRQVEALSAQEEYQRFQLEGAYLALTANLVTAAVQEASLRAQAGASRKLIEFQARQFAIVQRQFELGGIAQTDVLAQQAQLAQTRAALPPLEKALAQKQNQLAALTGRFPSAAPAAGFDLAGLTLPTELPLSLASQLVEQRPDVRAQEALLHKASAGIGVATANILPQFTLSGSLGSAALASGKLFSGPAAAWSLGAGMLQPIFHGGALNHQRKAALAAYDQAEAQYRSTVLKAFQDVADVLQALEFDAQTLKAQSEAEQSAAASLELAQKQFQAGAVSFLVLLNAERAQQQARIGLIQAQAARYADTAALFQALGGGWWNRTAAARDEAAGGRPASAPPQAQHPTEKKQ